MSALRGCTVIVLAGPGSRSRQVQIPRGFVLWLCLASLLSIGGSLLAGRQARAWFDPAAPRPYLSAPHSALVEHASAGAEQTVTPEPASEPPARPRSRHTQPPISHHGRWSMQASQSLHTTSEDGRPLVPGELALFDVNASQALRVQPFDASGRPNPHAFAELKSFMRCRRTGHTRDMNPQLVSLLTRIAGHYDGAVLHVISAHRAADDVVTRPSSQHTRGTAADIRILGVGVESLGRIARELGAGGVGVYPRTRFVHVDVRAQPYYWRDLGHGAVAMRAPP